MSTRKSHLKSRNGCETCKKRRVKCDERHPVCGSCMLRKVQCSFKAITTLTPPSTCNSERLDLTSPCPSISSIVSSRAVELASMHQWSTSTYKSICSVPADVKLWQEVAVKLAFKHEFLLNGLLAFSALNITLDSSSSASQPQLFYDAALSYYSAASTAFRGITMLTEDNFLASFLFSIIALGVNLVLPRCHAQNNSRHSMLASILETFNLFHGSCNMTEPNLEWLLDSPISIPPELHKDPKWYLNAETTMAIARLHAINKQITSRTSTLARTSDGDMDEEELYDTAIQHLELCFARETEGSIQFFYLGWPELCTKPFLEAMINSKPMALILLIHWGVLLDGSKAWWVGTSGKNLVEELAEMLKPMYPNVKEWKEAVEWALKMVRSEHVGVRRY